MRDAEALALSPGAPLVITPGTANEPGGPLGPARLVRVEPRYHERRAQLVALVRPEGSPFVAVVSPCFLEPA